MMAVEGCNGDLGDDVLIACWCNSSWTAALRACAADLAAISYFVSYPPWIAPRGAAAMIAFCNSMPFFAERPIVCRHLDDDYRILRIQADDMSCKDACF
jgi:hypothetical protein